MKKLLIITVLFSIFASAESQKFYDRSSKQCKAWEKATQGMVYVGVATAFYGLYMHDDVTIWAGMGFMGATIYYKKTIKHRNLQVFYRPTSLEIGVACKLNIYNKRRHK